MADRPSSRTAACAPRPRTSPAKVSAPAWAHTTSKPVGSGIRQASKAESRSSAAKVPCPPSSSDATAWSTTSHRADSRAAAMACSAATTAPFMSTAPRPCTEPSSIAPDQGPWRHGSEPGATTSTWPLRHSRGAPAGPGSVTVRPRSSERSASSPGVAGKGAQRGEVVLVQLGLEPHARGHLPHQLERGALVARDAGHLHERRHVAGQGVAGSSLGATLASNSGSSEATPPEMANTRTSAERSRRPRSG